MVFVFRTARVPARSWSWARGDARSPEEWAGLDLPARSQSGFASAKAGARGPARVAMPWIPRRMRSPRPAWAQRRPFRQP